MLCVCIFGYAGDFPPSAPNSSPKMGFLSEDGDSDHSFLKGNNIENHQDSTEKKYYYREKKVYVGLSFASFDLGLTKLIDKGKGTLSPENEFLEYRPWKSINIGFDVAKVTYRASDNFRITFTPGFDWTFFRLKKNVIILEDVKPLTYENSDINYSKNRFGTSYLRLPLAFEFRSNADHHERLKFSFGPIGGLLIQGSQKFKSKEEGKRKKTGDFNFMPFRYGGFVRASYGSVGVYVKYYFNDVFQNSPEQKDLKNISFGLTLGL